MKAAEIPRVNTPEGGWKGEMPGPILSSCTEPIADGLPDLRGTWQPVEILVNGEAAPPEVPLWKHVERIEQAGTRVVITSDGIIHDFPSADGSFDNGCHDVAAMDFTTPIVVAASFEDGVLILRPQGLEGVQVRRWRDGDDLAWDYHGAFRMRLTRIDTNR